MYVHIGKDYIIEEKNIISILDLENLLENKKIEDILKELKIENNIINNKNGNEKSLILVKKQEKIEAYFSNISSTTLVKRMQKEII